MIPKHGAFLLAGILLLTMPRSGAANWLETRIAIEDFAAAGDYAAAAELSDELIDQVRQEFGEPSPELAAAYRLLADIDRGNDKLLEAEGRLLAAIETHEQLEGPLSTQLIEPYVELGETYHAAEEDELALGAYEQARSIGRRAFGLLNQDQVPILKRMSRVALDLGDYDEAKALQLDVVTVIQRYYGESSVEYLDANYDYASWLRQMQDYEEARHTYHSIERIIEDHFDDDPVLLVQLLRTQAASLLANRFQTFAYYRPDPRDLERALKIAEDIEPPEPVLHAAVLRDLGDWNVAFGLEDSDEHYLEAWHLLAGIEGGENLQREWFNEQTVIRQAPLSARALTLDPDAPRGSVDLVFRIDPWGRTGDIEVVDSNPPGLIDRAAIRQIARSSFRPRIVNGKLITATGYFTWNFHYDPVTTQRSGARVEPAD